MSRFTVLVTAEYESDAACAFDAALRVIEALRTGGQPWPAGLRIEVAADGDGE